MRGRWRERGRERKGERAERAEQSGKTGITIECKSLDKRAGIVKTRSARGSILILYVASQGRARSDKGQKSTRVAVFNSDDDCRHSSGSRAAGAFYHRNTGKVSLSRIPSGSFVKQLEKKVKRIVKVDLSN